MMTYESFDKTKIHTLFVKPKVARLGSPPPAIVYVHGGPNAQQTLSLRSVHPAAGRAGFRGHRPELPRLDRLRPSVRGRQQQGLGRRRSERPRGRGQALRRARRHRSEARRHHRRQLRRLHDADGAVQNAGRLRRRRRILWHARSGDGLYAQQRAASPIGTKPRWAIPSATPRCSASARRCRTSTTSRRRCWSFRGPTTPMCRRRNPTCSSPC